MKKVLIILLTISFSLSFYSCDDALDINTDPLAATEANPNAVLPFVFAEYTARKTSELGTRISDVFQHLGDTFNSPKNGATTSFLTGNTWAVWYTNLMGNLTLLEQDAAAAGEASNNVQAVAKIMKAHLFMELSLIWEDVPYTEALDGEQFPNPAFDSQETILRGLVDDFDDAIALIDAMPAEGNFDFSNGDVLLGGDITRWRALANSMKIRVLMIIRNVDPSVSASIAAAYNEPVVSAPVYIRYEGGSGADNAYFDLVNAFFGPSNEEFLIYGPAPVFRNQLFNTNDPRLNQFLVDLSGTGNFPTVTYDNFPTPTTTVFSDNIIRGTLPDVYFLPSELDLYAAELELAGVDVPGYASAQAAFEQGVTYAVNYYSGNADGQEVIDGYQGSPASSAEVAAFVAGLGPVTLENIHTQLWLEAFLRPVMAWTHVRRTDTPALTPAGGATISTILKRFTYPPDEVASNPNTPANKANTDVPMWFENGDNGI